jgi:broad specificity phosphatase PhoE
MRTLRLAAFAAVFVFAAQFAAAAQVIFVVRHAERAEAAAMTPAPKDQPAGHGMMIADDVPITPAGRERAKRLAAILRSSGIKRIYTTEYQRTRQTAAPLAEALHLKPIMTAAKDMDPLVAALERLTEPALVVGHANTIPDLLRKLGVTGQVAIGDDEYDNLFVVVRSGTGPATLVRLRY